jgi:hypothetical protein
MPFFHNLAHKISLNHDAIPVVNKNEVMKLSVSRPDICNTPYMESNMDMYSIDDPGAIFASNSLFDEDHMSKLKRCYYTSHQEINHCIENHGFEGDALVLLSVYQRHDEAKGVPYQYRQVNNGVRRGVLTELVKISTQVIKALNEKSDNHILTSELLGRTVFNITAMIDSERILNFAGHRITTAIAVNNMKDLEAHITIVPPNYKTIQSSLKNLNTCLMKLHHDRCMRHWRQMNDSFIRSCLRGKWKSPIAILMEEKCLTFVTKSDEDLSQETTIDHKPDVKLSASNFMSICAQNVTNDDSNVFMRPRASAPSTVSEMELDERSFEFYSPKRKSSNSSPLAIISSTRRMIENITKSSKTGNQKPKENDDMKFMH